MHPICFTEIVYYFANFSCQIGSTDLCLVSMEVNSIQVKESSSDAQLFCRCHSSPATRSSCTFTTLQETIYTAAVSRSLYALSRIQNTLSGAQSQTASVMKVTLNLIQANLLSFSVFPSKTSFYTEATTTFLIQYFVIKTLKGTFQVLQLHLQHNNKKSILIQYNNFQIHYHLVT